MPLTFRPHRSSMQLIGGFPVSPQYVEPVAVLPEGQVLRTARGITRPNRDREGQRPRVLEVP